MKDYHSIICFHLKSACVTEFPFFVDYNLLFKLAHNAAKVEKDAKEFKCYCCKCLVTDLEHQKRRTIVETPRG